MNDSAQTNGNPAEEALDKHMLEFLGTLPCEQAAPSARSDLAIHRAAAARMAMIRRRTRMKRVCTTVAAMAACLLLCIYLTNRPKPETPRAVDLPRDESAMILRELSALFPGQIRAILRDAGGLHLTLSETPDVNSTLAVVIELGDPANAREIITFSGQTIEFMGRSVTVQADPEHGILLNGKAIEWWNTQHSSHLSIRTLSI